jgi:N-acetylglucosamine kinase-like BadF-type ATPase
VIVAGTGAIALAASDAGWARADGWGPMLGDDGGGYWIGRRALALALREHDGRAAPRGDAAWRGGGPAARGAAVGGGVAGGAAAAGGPAARGAAVGGGVAGGVPTASLRAAAEARFGPLARIAGAVYDAADPVATVAAFARDVADLARGGDAAAVAILAAAGRELARTATAALDRAPSCPRRVSWSGGVFAAGDLILDPLRSHLDAELVAPAGDAIDGAARLLERPAMFGDLIQT